MPEKILNDKSCTLCQGTGKFMPDCSECDGKGWVEDTEEGGTMNCPTCENEDCDECDGEGYVMPD